MFHAKGIDGARVVVARLLLLGVEAHALADDGLARAGRAPDWEGHFEADGEDAGGGVAGARAQRVSCMRTFLELVAGESVVREVGRRKVVEGLTEGENALAGYLVGGYGAFELGRDVASSALALCKRGLRLEESPDRPISARHGQQKVLRTRG